MWDRSTHERVWAGQGAHLQTVVAFSRRGTWLASGGDGAVLISLARSHRKGLTVPPPDLTRPRIVRVAFSPADDLLAVAAVGVQLFAFDEAWPDGVSKENWSGVAGGMYNPALAFSPDGALLATGSRLWRVADQTLVWSKADAPRVPDDRNDSGFPDQWASFSHDGRRLVLSASYVNTPGLVLTDLVSVEDGSTIRTLTGGRHPVFSPDDRFLLAGSTLVEAATGQPRALPFDAATSIFLEGWTIAAGGADGTVKLYCPVKNGP